MTVTVLLKSQILNILYVRIEGLIKKDREIILPVKPEKVKRLGCLLEHTLFMHFCCAQL